MKSYFIYIISNKNRTVFYIGVTGNLRKRIAAHAEGLGSTFAKRYNLVDLIYYEAFLAARQAIDREKQLKNWKRQWKIDLITQFNPELQQLSCD